MRGYANIQLRTREIGYFMLIYGLKFNFQTISKRSSSHYTPRAGFPANTGMTGRCSLALFRRALVVWLPFTCLRSRLSCLGFACLLENGERITMDGKNGNKSCCSWRESRLWLTDGSPVLSSESSSMVGETCGKMLVRINFSIVSLIASFARTRTSSWQNGGGTVWRHLALGVHLRLTFGIYGSIMNSYYSKQRQW